MAVSVTGLGRPLRRAREGEPKKAGSRELWDMVLGEQILLRVEMVGMGHRKERRD